MLIATDLFNISFGTVTNVEDTDKTKPNDESAEAKVHKHSKVISGFRTLDETLHWRFETTNLFPNEDESIEIRFFVLLKDCPAPMQSDAMKMLLKQMESDQVAWLSPGRSEWAFDLDRMKAEFEGLQDLEWCRGRV